MPSESAKLFRMMAFEYKAPLGATVLFSTDLPGEMMSVRATITLPAMANRGTFKYAFPQGVTGRIVKIRVYAVNSGAVELYHARLYARRTGMQASDWTWYDLNVAPNVEWVPVKIPIPPTSNELRAITIPIPPTPDAFQNVKIPIPPTPDQWSPLKLAIEPSSTEYIWHELPMDRP